MILFLGVVTALPLIFLLLTTINITVIMNTVQVRLYRSNTIVTVNTNQTLQVGSGYEDYYFVLIDGVVYYGAKQEDTIYLRMIICNEEDSAIIFPCYNE